MNNTLKFDFSEVFGKPTVKIKVIDQKVIVFCPNRELSLSLIDECAVHHIGWIPYAYKGVSCIKLTINPDKIEDFINSFTSQVNLYGFEVTRE